MNKTGLGLLIYWVLGCLIVGQAAGMDAVSCPRDPAWPPSTMVAMVAVWPVAFGYVLRNPHPVAQCSVAP